LQLVTFLLEIGNYHKTAPVSHWQRKVSLLYLLVLCR